MDISAMKMLVCQDCLYVRCRWQSRRGTVHWSSLSTRLGAKLPSSPHPPWAPVAGHAWTAPGLVVHR